MSLLSYEIEHFNPYSPRVSELTAIPSGPDILVLPGQQHGGHFSPNREPTQTVEFVHPSGGSLDSAESATVKISSVGCTPSRRPAPIPIMVKSNRIFIFGLWFSASLFAFGTLVFFNLMLSAVVPLMMTMVSGAFFIGSWIAGDDAQ